jgi:hypothetical protein
MRFHGLAVVTVFVSSLSAAQFRPLETIPRSGAGAPRNVVREFCRLDYVGSRLAPETWSRMKELTTWKGNPDWRSLTVVSRYDMGDASESFRSARISVHYQVLGRFDPGIGFTPEPASQDVEFRLKEIDGQWRIDSTDPPATPHVSKPRLVQWLQTALPKEKDAANRAVMQNALQQLQEKTPAPQP